MKKSKIILGLLSLISLAVFTSCSFMGNGGNTTTTIPNNNPSTNEASSTSDNPTSTPAQASSTSTGTSASKATSTPAHSSSTTTRTSTPTQSSSTSSSTNTSTTTRTSTATSTTTRTVPVPTSTSTVPVPTSTSSQATSGSSSSSSSSSSQPTQDTYEVVFTSNCDTQVTTQTIRAGELATEPTGLSKASTAQYTYTFDKWYKDEDCTIEYDFTTPVNSALHLYANWISTTRKYTITFLDYDESEIDSKTLNYGTQITTPTKPTRTGTSTLIYTFDGWYTAKTGGTKVTSFGTVTGEATYYARYNEVEVDENTITADTAYSFKGYAVQTGDIIFSGSGEGIAPFTESKLTVNTQSGKFVSNGGVWYQINTGTILSFKTSQSVKVTITMYGNGQTANLYSITGTGLSASNSEIEQSFNTNGAGTVTITATANDYIGRLKIELLDETVQAQSITAIYTKTSKISNTSHGNGQYKTVNAKTIYKVGDSLDTSGIYGIVSFSDSTTEMVLASSLTFTGFDSSTTGKKTVTISYEAGGVAVTTTYDVYVIDTAPAVVSNVVQVKVNPSYSGTPGTNVSNYNMFKTINQALDYLRALDSQYTNSQKLLYVTTGTYNEKLWIDVPYLTIRGANKTNTIIEYDSLYYNSSYDSVSGYKAASIDPDGFGHVTDSTQTMTIAEAAVGCTLYDITISNYWNSYNRFYDAFGTNHIEHRALALLIYADKVVVQDCRLLGYQDTLEAMSGRSYFYKSYISGATDFIFGTNPTIYFEDCEIRSIYNGSTDGGYINAFKGVNQGGDSKTYGVVYNNCRFTKDDQVTSSNTSIARPWDYYSKVIVMNSQLGAHISKTAYTTGTTKNQRYVCWTVSGQTAAQPTSEHVDFFEYNNSGDGAITDGINGMTLVDETTANNYINKTKIYGEDNGYSDSWTPATIDGSQQQTTEINITAQSGYAEGAYVEFTTTADNITASYKKSSDTNYTAIDSELVRMKNDTGRVDVIGLTAGTYTIKLVDSANSEVYVETNNLTVSADDRSGYAHYDNSNHTSGSVAVGAYNVDGTLKTNAKVIYVTDENKNTVSYDGCTGLVAILQGNHSVPLDIRIIGTIKTTQWNRVTYTETAKSVALYEKQSEKLGGTGKTGKVYASTILDSNNNWNSYSDDIALGITELNGLTSYASCSIKDSGKSSEHYEWDSYWNMCDISGRSNITIEGIGTDAGIFQWGFTFAKCNSIEVKNLTFDDYTEDAIGIQGGSSTDLDYHNYWIHNCTFEEGVNRWDVSYEQDKGDGDGSTDFKYAHNLTISYCKYNGTHKTNLIGADNAAKQYNITLHHNYYLNCNARLPLVRQANIHMYNNYYMGTTSTGISARAHAFAFVENCYFDGKNPYMLAYETSKSVDPVGTTIKAIGNEFSSSTSTSDSSSNGLGIMMNGIFVLTGADSNKAYSSNLSATRTDTSSISVCTPVGTTDYTNFDTDSTKFYYDSTNHVSDVSTMNNASELPTLIPTIAGAGVCGGSFTGGSSSGSGSGSSTPAQTYTLSYDVNGHGTAPNSVDVSTITSSELPNLTAEGFKFGGWYYEAACTNKVTAGTALTTAKTIYAKWTQNNTPANMVLNASDMDTTTSNANSGTNIVDNVDVTIHIVKSYKISECNENVAFELDSYSFDKVLLPSGSTDSTNGYTITAKGTITITVYYTITDSSGFLTGTVRSGNIVSNDITPESSSSAPSNSVAGKLVLNMTNGQSTTIYTSANRLAILAVVVD